MVDRQQQTAFPLWARVKPHRLHQMPRRRIEPQFRCLGFPADQRAQPASSRSPASTRRRHASTRTEPDGITSNVQSGSLVLLGRSLVLRSLVLRSLRPAARIEPQPQRIVMVQQRLQRRRQILLPQTRRRAQQQRLAEPPDRTAALAKPAHDRGRRQRTHRDVGNGRLQQGSPQPPRARPEPQPPPRPQAPPRSDAGTPDAASAEDPHAAPGSPAGSTRCCRRRARRSCRPAPHARRRSTSANSPHSTASAGVRAARYSRSGPASGAGSARRSSLPFAVSGRRSSTTNA